jgi:hypothetical protein
MSKSYKIVVLTAMLNRNELPGSIRVADLVSEVRKLARRDPRIGEDFGNALDDDQGLEAHLRRNPVEAWIGGRGTAGTKYFSFDDGIFRSEFSIPNSSIAAAQELIREVVDWRLAEYFARSTPNKDQQFVLKVSHANGNSILFLPDRNAHPDLPEGWTEIRIDGEILRANFVKVALNVVERTSGEGNVLSQVLRRWFGEDAGLPGTRHRSFSGWNGRDGHSLRSEQVRPQFSRIGATNAMQYRLCSACLTQSGSGDKGSCLRARMCSYSLRSNKQTMVKHFNTRITFFLQTSSNGRARTERPKRARTGS